MDPIFGVGEKLPEEIVSFGLTPSIVNSTLQHLYNTLEADRTKLLSAIKDLPLEKLQYAPKGKWSAHQILAHIIAAEKISINYLNKKILGINEVDNTGMWEEIKMILLQFSQRLPFKFKAPRVVVDATPVYSSFNDLLADWDRTRAELKTLLERFDDSQVRKKIYKHVRAGKLNIRHALLFFREHIIHHRPQLDRLLKL